MADERKVPDAVVTLMCMIVFAFGVMIGLLLNGITIRFQ